MSTVDVSIIIPSNNNKEQIASVIKRLDDETRNIETEFIVIDMNSSDGGVLNTLNVIKELNLRGCVIQSGGSTVSSALNTGIYKSVGKYVTFVYPSRTYRNYIEQYYSEITEKEADFVFAVPESDDGSRVLISDGVTGTDLVVSLIRSSIKIDFTAVMFRREFLCSKGAAFYEDCTIGYAEAFIYNALLNSPTVAYSTLKLERVCEDENSKFEIKASKNCFERLEAMIRIFTAARELHKNDQVLLNMLEFQKLPSVVLDCIDKLLNEGFKYSSIKKLLKSKDYAKYIDFSKDTDSSLRNRILVWKMIPWLYRPQT